MKQRKVGLFVSFLLLLFVGEGLISCAPRMAQVKETGVPQISDIQVTELPSKVEIKVFSEKPLVYTTFQLSDPERLVVDLAGVDLSRFKTMKINQGNVVEIRPIPGKSETDVSRLEVVLAKKSMSDVRMEDGTLYIDIYKELSGDVSFPQEETSIPEQALAPGDAVVEEDLAQTVEESAMKAKMESSLDLPPAKKITEIRTETMNDDVKVIIEGDGFLKQESFLVDGNRVVIDLVDTTSFLESHLLPGKGDVIKRIRVGQHFDPKKVRVVLDLTRPEPYTVEPSGKSVVLTFSPVSKQEQIVSKSAAAKNAPEPGTETRSPAVESPPSQTSDQMEQEKSVSKRVEKADSKTPSIPRKTPVAKKTKALGERILTAEGEIIQEKRYSGQRISLDFQDAEITNIIRLISDVSGFNVIVGSDVKGKVTLKLINVPWDQALDIILKMNGLGQLREGNIIRIATLANIAKQQKAEADAKQATLEAEDLVTKIIPVNYSKASKLSPTLKKNLSSRGDITVNDETNTLVVKDLQQNIDEVSDLVKVLDRQTPQVMIEARIVQANISFARDLGVQWGGDYTSRASSGLDYAARGGIGGPATAPTTGFVVNLPASGIAGPLGSGSFTVGRLGRFNLDLRLSAGETTGETKLISTPRITTLDNKEAKIQQGESIPFETVSQSGTQTQFVDATLNLTVTPHITPDGSIIMEIKATKNAIGTFRSSITGTPSIDKREATTEVLVKDGETAVIGGIFEATEDESIAGVPWFHKIPVLGWFFKRQSTSDVKRELLIFITPTILQPKPAV